MDSSSLLRLKQENFRIKIRREKTEEIFRQKRLNLLGLSSELVQEDGQHLLLHVLPQAVIRAFNEDNTQELVASYDKLTSELRHVCIKAEASLVSDPKTYENLEKLVETFFMDNQDLIEIMMGFCYFQISPRPQDYDGFMGFNTNETHQLLPQHFLLCKLTFLNFTNMAFFSNENIIRSLADREISGVVLKRLLDKLDRRQFQLNRSECCNIIDNVLGYFSNLLVDRFIRNHEIAKDIVHDLACSSLTVQLKLCVDNSDSQTSFNHRGAQIRFLKSMFNIDVPDDLNNFQANVVYFIQTAVYLISHKVKIHFYDALCVLIQLIDNHGGLISIATKSLWQILVEQLHNQEYTKIILQFFGYLAFSQEETNVPLQIIDLGILEEIVRLLNTRMVDYQTFLQILSLLKYLQCKDLIRLVDTISKEMMSRLVQLYGFYCTEGMWVEEGALMLMDVVQRVVQSRHVTLAGQMYCLESEILENMVDSLKKWHQLLRPFVQFLFGFQFADSLIIADVYMRLNQCNCHQIVQMAFTLSQTDDFVELNNVQESYEKLILEWNELLQQMKTISMEHEL